jgi:addiction module RelB/DinJ family antitoxin
MKVQDDVRVTIRVDRDLKEHAEVLFERTGMNMNTALNIFLRKTVDESAIPFPISVKNSIFGYDLSPNDVSDAFATAVQETVAEKRRNGFPVAHYDADKKQAFLEYPDGMREYVNG